MIRALDTYLIDILQLVIGVQWLVSDPADINDIEETVVAVLSENSSSTTLAPMMTLKEASHHYMG